MNDATRAALQQLADDTAAEHHCPTLTWGVARDGALAAHGGSPDTVMRIASMTKSFTAAAVLALRDEGTLDLHRPVTEYAPELAGVVPPAGSPPLTLRQLLSMASGLATDDAWADRHLDIDEAEIDRVYAAGPAFAHRPDTAFEYSNLGYAIVGRVVRRATGVTVQEHVTERFLRPLGLERTTWVCPDHDDWARPHRVEDARSVPEGHPPLSDGELAPMGGLWSTVADLARWAAWLDDANSTPDATRWVGLSPASRRELQRVHTFIGLAAVAGHQGPAGYCLGLRRFDDPQIGPVIAHSGGLPGYGSNMRWVAGRGVGVVALANTTYAPMSVLTMRMLAVLHEAGEVPPAPALEAERFDEQCRRLVALLNDWDDAEATALFADNVGPDESFARRAAAAAALVATHGELRIVAVRPASATSGTVTVQGHGEPLQMSVELAPLAGAPVQLYPVQA